MATPAPELAPDGPSTRRRVLRSAVWVTAESNGRWELVRVDADDRKVTGRAGVGSDMPQTIVPVGSQVWVITERGDVLRVSQG